MEDASVSGVFGEFLVCRWELRERVFFGGEAGDEGMKANERV